MDDNNQQNQVSSQGIQNQPPVAPPMMPPQPAIQMPSIPEPAQTNAVPVPDMTAEITPPAELPDSSFLPPPPLPPTMPPQQVANEPLSAPSLPLTQEPVQPAQLSSAVFSSPGGVAEIKPEEQKPEEPFVPKKKRRVIPAILAALAILLVGGIAGASYFVSTRLSQQTAVAPNAPESQPQAACPTTCGEANCASGFHCISSSSGGSCYTCAQDGGTCPVGQIYCGGCISGCRGASITCNQHIANECGSGSSSGGDCFSKGCPSGKCCLCSEGREASGNCKGGSNNSYCGSCSDPGADWIQCGTQQCDPADEECCPNGCFQKGSNCGNEDKPKNNEACYFDTKSDINGKEVMAGSSIRIAGWGGICRDNKLLADRVDVHICNEDGSNCVGLKGTIARNDRSESTSQTNLCTTSVPGKPNTLGFNDNVTIPTTVTAGSKRIKVVVVSTYNNAQVTKWCEEPVFTLKQPEAPACVAVKFAYKNSSGAWVKINNDQITSNAKTGDTVRLYATGNAVVKKARFKVTQPDGSAGLTPEWREGTKEGTDYFIEFVIGNQAGSYTFEAEVQ